MSKKKKTHKFILILSLIFITVMSLIVWKQEVYAPYKKSDSSNAKHEKITEETIPAIQNTTVEQTATDLNKIIADLNIPILMYHYVRIVEDKNDTLGINLSVTPEKFAQQLDLIVSRGYKTVTFNDIQKGEIPVKPIILTFDDGYKDFYINAYPELKKRKMSGVSYVIANKDNAQYMNEKEITEISQNNIEIGSHTLSHPDLVKISDEQVTVEIAQSKEKIEKITDKKVISFCYPAGRYNNNTVNIVKSAGYAFAVTTNPSIGSFKNPFILSRYRINADTNINAYLK